MHGRAATEGAEEEHDQLSSGQALSEDRGAEEEKVDIGKRGIGARGKRRRMR